MRLWQYNQEELDQIQPPDALPAPDDPDPGRAAQIRQLAQYRGWTADGWKRSAGNLKRHKHMTEPAQQPETTLPDTLPDDQPPADQPSVPVPPVLGGPQTARYRQTRAVLSELELATYCETWNHWFADHPEYTLAEDQTDVAVICWETVIQQRLRTLQAQRPKEYDARAYHESALRLQRARENLAARRTDRLEHQKKGQGATTNFNIAVMAGQADPRNPDIDKSARQQVIVVQNEQEQQFLEVTKRRTENPLPLQARNQPDQPDQPAQTPELPGQDQES